MANTLKFGNGQFATKKGSTLAYNDENGNFKPLPFSFDRSTSATRVNKQGLIEVVPNNEPRIDFLNDSKGALLLEPSRSNLVTYSEDFTQWSSLGTPTVVLSSSLAPNGSLDAYEITDDAGVYEIVKSNSSSFDGTYTVSIFIKKTTGVLTHYAGLEILALGSYLIIDTTNGTVNQTASEYSNIKVEDFSDWWRISATAANTGTGVLLNVWAAISNNGTSISSSATGTNTFFGAQLEEGSYATSYIPTQGGIGTRVVESCNNAGNSTVFNDSEGVLYTEIAKSDVTASEGGVRISRDTSNEIRLNFATGNRLNVFVNVGGSNQVYMDNTSYNLADYHKVAIKYKLNDYAVYVDGTEIHTDTSATVPTGLDKFNFSTLYGKVKDVRIYNTALTDQELINLTTI